jgi:hypothetical protein
MKKFLLTIVYATLCYIPLLFLKNAFDLGNSWWLDLLLIGFSYFTGSFIYTQFHGTQVMELKHLGSVNGTNKFQVTLKVSGYGILNIVGQYTRINSYSDQQLQGKLFKTLNSFPGNKWIREFAQDRNEKDLNISVDDPEMQHPLNFTQIELEKYDSENIGNRNHDGLRGRKEVENELERLSKYEIGMKLWNEEQELLEKARKDGVEDQLIAYWEAQGRPRMKKPPTKED